MMNSLRENNDFDAPCQWMYTLEGDCKEKESIKDIMFASAIAFGVIALIDACVILRKLYKKKIENWKDWTSLEYMLGFAFLLFTLRSFDNFVVIYNLFPNAIIFRVSLFTISWIPGSLGMHFYIAEIFRTIPRLSFHRLTSKDNTLWIPNSKHVFISSLFTSTGLILSSILAGYFVEKGEYEKKNIAFSMQMLFFLIICLIIWSSLFYYGRALISLTRESSELAGVEDGKKENVKKKFRIYIRKMKMYNYLYGGLTFLFCLPLVPLTTSYKWTMVDHFTINLLYCLFCNTFHTLMVIMKAIILVYSQFQSDNLEKSEKSEQFDIIDTYYNNN